MTVGANHPPRRPSIESYPDGPLLVRGDVEVLDERGEPIESQRRTLALCRCGASLIKPLCDGTHKVTGFRTDPAPAD